MGKILYLECASGISGDMTVGALLDLGADQGILKAALDSLPVEGYQVRISRVSKSGLDACDFAVLLDEAHENHDHDMDYLHGHHHGHAHHHEHHEHHEHRNLPEILHIIDHGQMTPGAKALAEKVFTILAQAESKAHGVPIEEVHFHEVGAVDSIVDIVAASVCFDNLDITEVIIPQLNEGTGFVRCQHGFIPVPVPATLHIVEDNGLTLHMTGVEGELVTPTGAALAAAVKTGDCLPEQFRVVKTGLGAGKRNYERPSLLRAMVIEESGATGDEIWKLETNVDDCTGEALGYVMERLLESGARDVHYLPVFMKKNRPAYQINVICDEKDIPVLETILFRETTTIGIRRVRMERSVLRREIRMVDTPLGVARVKTCTLPDGQQRTYPEYDSVVKLCREHGMAYQEVYQIIQNSAEWN